MRKIEHFQTVNVMISKTTIGLVLNINFLILKVMLAAELVKTAPLLSLWEGTAFEGTLFKLTILRSFSALSYYHGAAPPFFDRKPASSF